MLLRMLRPIVQPAWAQAVCSGCCHMYQILNYVTTADDCTLRKEVCSRSPIVLNVARWATAYAPSAAERRVLAQEAA
jgi:hypothetical protein